MEVNQKSPDSLEALNEIILPVLCRQFKNKGLKPTEIKRLTRDILNIIGQGGLYNAGILNQRLENLGWEKNILDNYTFELIVYYLEC